MSEPHDVANCTVPECEACRFAAKCRTIQIGAGAMPFRRAGAIAGAQHDAMLDKDLPAYKRLRQQGLQPKSTRHAAQLETRATSVHEIVSGRILPKDQARRVDRVKAQLTSEGLIG